MLSLLSPDITHCPLLPLLPCLVSILLAAPASPHPSLVLTPGPLSGREGSVLRGPEVPSGPFWFFSPRGGGGGGGYSVWKRVPTAVRPLWSGGCRDPRWLKRGGCPLIILYNRGAVRVFASNIPHQITIVCIQICS